MPVLGIDLGTTRVKAAVYDTAGRLAGSAAVSSPTRRPVDGAAEQDPAAWLRAAGRAVRSALAAAGGSERVDAIGFASQRETFCLVDARGRILRPAITWQDQRGADLLAAWRDRHGDAAIQAATGLWPGLNWTAVKLAHLTATEPDVIGSTRWVLAARDFVYLRWTGEVATDPSLASRTLLRRLDGAGWWTPGLELAGIDEAVLPPVMPSGSAPGRLRTDVAGRLGLPPGVPLVLGGGDRPCENLGAGGGCVEAHGTTTGITTEVGSGQPPIPGVQLAHHVNPGRRLLETGVGASGAALEWCRHLTGTSRSRFDALVAGLDLTAVPPPGTPVVLPWFTGARLDRAPAGARALVAGLSLATGPQELVRAVLLGIAVEIAAAVERLRAHGVTVEEIGLLGAGALGPTWPALLAELTGVPHRLRAGDAARGAAMLAAEHLGLDLPPGGSAGPLVEPAPIGFSPDAHEHLRHALLS